MLTHSDKTGEAILTPGLELSTPLIRQIHASRARLVPGESSGLRHFAVEENDENTVKVLPSASFRLPRESITTSGKKVDTSLA